MSFGVTETKNSSIIKAAFDGAAQVIGGELLRTKQLTATIIYKVVSDVTDSMQSHQLNVSLSMISNFPQVIFDGARLTNAHKSRLQTYFTDANMGDDVLVMDNGLFFERAITEADAAEIGRVWAEFTRDIT